MLRKAILSAAGLATLKLLILIIFVAVLLGVLTILDMYVFTPLLGEHGAPMVIIPLGIMWIWWDYYRKARKETDK